MEENKIFHERKTHTFPTLYLKAFEILPAFEQSTSIP